MTSVDMNEMVIEMLQLLEEVNAKMKRVHEIKAKFDSMKNNKPVKSNTVTCSCGCTVVFSSLKRHQKTKKHSDLIVSNTLFDGNCFYSCNSISYDNLVFECIAEVGGVRRFIRYQHCYKTTPIIRLK